MTHLLDVENDLSPLIDLLKQREELKRQLRLNERKQRQLLKAQLRLHPQTDAHAGG